MVLKTVLALGVKRARKGKICGEVEGHGRGPAAGSAPSWTLRGDRGARPLAAVSPTVRLELGRAEGQQRCSAATRPQCESDDSGDTDGRGRITVGARDFMS